MCPDKQSKDSHNIFEFVQLRVVIRVRQIENMFEAIDELSDVSLDEDLLSMDLNHLMNYSPFTRVNLMFVFSNQFLTQKSLPPCPTKIVESSQFHPRVSTMKTVPRTHSFSKFK